MEAAIKTLIGVCITKGCALILEIGNKSMDNYTKRRNVGFGIIGSISGSFYETKNYYIDTINGVEPTEYIEAITFIDR